LNGCSSSCAHSSMQRPISSSRLGALLLATNAAALFFGVSHCFLFNRSTSDGAAFVVGMAPATTARGLPLVSEMEGGNFVGATREAHQGSTTASATTSSGTLLAAAAIVALGLRAAAGSKVFSAARADGRRVRLQAAKSDDGALAEASDDEDEDEGNDEFLDDEDAGDLLGYDDDDDDAYAFEDEDDRVEAIWRGRGLSGSPWKYRRVLWQIRGRSYRDALILLEFLPWRHCKPVLTGLQSAAANAQNQFNMDKSRLYISRAWCGKGPYMKRMRPQAKGQPHRYVKRTSHVVIRVAEMEDEELDNIIVS